MRAVVEEVDPGLPVSEMFPLSALVAEDSARPRLLAAVISGFAALALVLAALGVYGVLAYVVRGRAREMGLRAALGASGRQILAQVVAGGMRPVAVGVAVGLGASALLTRSLESLLFGVNPLDPAAFALGTAVIAVTTLFACVVPALRAARADPMTSLKAE